MREIIISNQEEGQSLIRYLGKYLPKASPGFLHKMLRKKNIKLNQSKAFGNEKLLADDRIQIYFSEETLRAFGNQEKENKAINPPDLKREDKLLASQKELRRQVKILYQDEHILILHKPAGMLTQKAALEDDSLNDYLLDCWYGLMEGKKIPANFRPSVANRLDRNTSGIVLCGITTKGLQLLSRLLKHRNLEKYYLCLVKGKMTENRKIHGFLNKDEKNNKVEIYEKQIPGSVPVETWYEVVKAGEEASLLKVRLITGKSHQIRAHLSSVGHPILGDVKYGDPHLNRKLYRDGIRHQMLHSSELVVPKNIQEIPAKYCGLHIEDPAPQEFKNVMIKYGLAGKYNGNMEFKGP